MALPITALSLAGQGLGLAGRGAMGAAGMAGRTMVSPGIIGSMARWTAASMVLSSLPNPAARKQSIDRALHEANRDAEREYLSLRQEMKRNNELRKRQREFDFTQRILDSSFLANPEERNFERRMPMAKQDVMPTYTKSVISHPFNRSFGTIFRGTLMSMYDTHDRRFQQ